MEATPRPWELVGGQENAGHSVMRIEGDAKTLVEKGLTLDQAFALQASRHDLREAGVFYAIEHTPSEMYSDVAIQSAPFTVATILSGYVCTMKIVRKVDANHIVQCVNTHDAMVEALEEAQRELDMERRTGKPVSGHVLMSIRAALALAKGGA